MKTYIQLTKEQRQQAEDFADLREKNDSSFYKTKRGAFKREDIVVGALGEIATYRFYSEGGVTISEPDFTIHKKKSYDADLRTKESFIHVKSQSKESEDKYGCSYLFQKTDKLVTEPLKCHDISCCVVDLEKNLVEIKGIYRATIIKWGEPKLEFLKKTKVALYIYEQTFYDKDKCIDCGVETESGQGSARCPECWDARCGSNE